MSATVLRDKRQITLPAEVCEPAELKLGDQVDWIFDGKNIIGQKLVRSSRHYRPGRVARDPETGLLYFDGDISAEEAEAAALTSNLDRS